MGIVFEGTLFGWFQRENRNFGGSQRKNETQTCTLEGTLNSNCNHSWPSDQLAAWGPRVLVQLQDPEVLAARAQLQHLVSSHKNLRVPLGDMVHFSESPRVSEFVYIYIYILNT